MNENHTKERNITKRLVFRTWGRGMHWDMMMPWTHAHALYVCRQGWPVTGHYWTLDSNSLHMFKDGSFRRWTKAVPPLERALQSACFFLWTMAEAYALRARGIYMICTYVEYKVMNCSTSEISLPVSPITCTLIQVVVEFSSTCREFSKGGRKESYVWVLWGSPTGHELQKFLKQLAWNRVAGSISIAAVVLPKYATLRLHIY